MKAEQVKELKEFNQPMDQLISHLRRVYKLTDGRDLSGKEVVEFVNQIVKARLENE